jgi:peptide/nickel transport system substrate-binding protein
MKLPLRSLFLITVAVLTVAGCAPGPITNQTPGSPSAPGEASKPRGILKVGWFREPETLSPKFLGGSGNGEYQWTFTSTLTFRDLSGVPQPLLAREIPTQANGDWKVNPDGTMITTYRLRPNAQWHDGTQVTAGDYVFAFTVYKDKDLPITNPHPETLMDRVEAPDDLTISVFWNEPFAAANVLGIEQLVPLPRHILAEKYRTNHANFTIGEEWTTAYVGTGPFKVERWTPGVGITAKAHTGWALGAPKIETIDIRFIADQNAQVVAILSGDVDMINSPGIRAEEAAVAREQWGTNGPGYVKTWATRTSYVEFQYREIPKWQRAVTDPRIRKALLHATDRDGMADTVNFGFEPAAHAFISKTDALYPEVDRAIMKYPLDPARASALFAEAGWRRASEGGLLMNAAGETLDIDLAATASQERHAFIASDNWKSAGVNSQPSIIPAARARDGELRSSFTSASLNGRTIGPNNFVWTSSELPGPENRWAGSNRGSFVDAETDRLQRIRLTAINQKESGEATVALLKRTSEIVGVAPLIYSVEAIIARNRLKGPVGNYVSQEGITWNIHEWEVTD